MLCNYNQKFKWALQSFAHVMCFIFVASYNQRYEISVNTKAWYTTNMPKLEGPPTTDLDKIEITESGITKLLSELNADKAPGPDELPNSLLKNAAKEISPFLKDIFEHSIQIGKLPDEWVEANVAPVFKKRTCVCAKLLEHIICKSIMTHFTKKRIFNTCATWFPCRAFMRKSITIDHRRPGSKLWG